MTVSFWYVSNMRTWFRKAFTHWFLLQSTCVKRTNYQGVTESVWTPCACHNIHHCQRGLVYYEMRNSLICGGHKGFLYSEMITMTVASIARGFMEITAAGCSFIAVSVDHSVAILTQCWVEVPVVNHIPWEAWPMSLLLFFFFCVLPPHLYSVSKGIYLISECVNMCLYGPC